MKCFICNLTCGETDNSHFNIADKISQKSQTSYSDLIYSFIKQATSDYIKNINSIQGIICVTCATLIESFDNFQYEAKISEQLLKRQIYRNFKIQNQFYDGCILIDIDTEAGGLFRKCSKTEYICVKCTFRTTYSDTIAPHYRYHQLVENEWNPRILDDTVIGSTITTTDNTIATTTFTQPQQFENIEILDEIDVTNNFIDTITTTGTEYVEEMVDSKNFIYQHISDQQEVITSEEPIMDNITVDDFIDEDEEDLEYDDDIDDNKNEIKKQILYDLEQHKSELNYNHHVIDGDETQESYVITVNNQFVDSSEMVNLQIENLSSNTNNNSNNNVELMSSQNIKHEMINETGDELDINEVDYLDEELIFYQSASEHEYTNDDTTVNIRENREFQCDICTARCSDYLDIVKHMKLHITNAINDDGTKTLDTSKNETTKFKRSCTVCGRRNTSTSRCKHIEAISNDLPELYCETCEAVFLDMNCLIKHTLQQHARCDICNKEFRNKQSARHHIVVHNRCLFTCRYCDKVFKSKPGMKRHELTHAGLYKFHCELCSNKYHTKIRLIEHMTTHTKESLYVCEICGQNFRHNATYRLHVKWHFNPTPFKCEICHKDFKSQSLVAVHRRRDHEGERSYVCEYENCMKSFFSKGTYIRHTTVHTGLHIYNCAICLKGFNKKDHYGKHMASAHNDYSIMKRVWEYKVCLRPEKKDRSEKIDAIETVYSEDQI